MTEDAVEIDPFAPGTLDQETELAALTHAVEYANGFSLLFVLCNQVPQRRQLMAEVRARLPKFKIQEIHFSESVDHLLDALREQMDSPLPDAVFVSGLEHSLPAVASASTTPFVANLNASRNSFPQTLPRPVVLWVPEYVLTAIAQGAPDFFSIRSGVYAFAAAPEELAGFARAISAGDHWQAEGLPLTEKRDRVAAIKRLLAEYEALPKDRRDRQAELRLLERLGMLLYMQGDYVEALSQFQHELRLSKELGDREGVALSLHNIGVLHRDRGEYEQAMQHLEQSLRILEELGDRESVARSLHNIGLLHQYRGDFEQAMQRYVQSLRILEELGDRQGVARSLHNVGILHQRNGEFEQAIQCYELSLRMAEELGDHAGIAKPLHQIGRVHQARGEYGQALQRYEQSLRILEELGDREGIANSLGQIGKLYTEISRYEEAFSLLLKSLDAFREMQSPSVGVAVNTLKLLRARWGEQAFDAAWRAAKNEEVPSWLHEAKAVASSLQL